MRKEYLTKENIAWLLLAVGSFVICSLLMNLGIINSYYQITLYNICINIILAVSLNLVIGICGQFSLGHAGFMCIGAYAAGIITKMMPNFGGFVLGILVGFVLSAIVALIVIIYLLSNASMCSTSTSLKGISVVEEELVTDLNYAVIGESLYPILLVKVKNTSSTTKKVSFEANFYADDELLGDDQASYVVLAPGDEAILKAQSNRGYKFWTQHEYSYKITKWWIFNQ